jgi:hypothetical protein
VATLLTVTTLLLLASSCGDSTGAGSIDDVTIVPAGTPSPDASLVITSKGGQPAHTATAILAPPTEAPPPATVAPAPPARPTAIPATAVPPTSTPIPAPTAVPVAPNSGRWIDVDVTNYAVRLMDGETVVREIAPVGVGVAIDTGAYVSTQTGLFYVHTKAEALVYDAPFNTYISHWVGFDAAKDNGFHSFLKDAAGTVVDASTGRVSNGCIRTGDPEAVFAYAEIGMPVWVHW